MSEAIYNYIYKCVYIYNYIYIESYIYRVIYIYIYIYNYIFLNILVSRGPRIWPHPRRISQWGWWLMVQFSCGFNLNHVDSSGLLRDSRISMSYFFWDGTYVPCLSFFVWEEDTSCKQRIRGKRTAVTPYCSSGTVQSMVGGRTDSSMILRYEKVSQNSSCPSSHPTNCLFSSPLLRLIGLVMEANGPTPKCNCNILIMKNLPTLDSLCFKRACGS